VLVLDGVARATVLIASSDCNTRPRQLRPLASHRFSKSELPSGNGGIVLNVSEGGAAFRAVGPVKTSGPISFWLSGLLSASSTRIEGTGELAWTDETRNTGGLRFTQLSTRVREQIQSWPSASDRTGGRSEVSVRAQSVEPLAQLPVQDESTPASTNQTSIYPAPNTDVFSPHPEVLPPEIRPALLRSPTKRYFEEQTRGPFKAIALTVGAVMLALLFLYLYEAGAGPNWLARTFGGSSPHAVTSATASDGKVSAKGSNTDSAAQAGPQRPSTAALQTVEANPAKPPASEASAADTMLLKSPLPSGAVILQVAALAHEENASELVKSLRQKNFPAFLSTPSTNSAFYRVQVGPYADEESARAAQSELGRAGFNSFIRH